VFFRRKPEGRSAAFRALVANYGDRRRMDFNIHVCPDRSFLYFNSPKVVCSTTKASLNSAIAARQGRALELASMDDVHDRALNPMLTPKQVGYPVFDAMLTDPAVLRFSFVRDPVTRFCSAWRSKLQPRSRGTGPGAKLFAAMGWDAARFPTIEAFAGEAKRNPEVRDFDPHWRLQRRQIGFDLVGYDFIGHQESWAEDFAALTTRLWGVPAPVFDTRARFHKFKKSRTHVDEVGPALRRDIEAAYAEDFEMLEQIRARGLDRLG